MTASPAGARHMSRYTLRSAAKRTGDFSPGVVVVSRTEETMMQQRWPKKVPRYALLFTPFLCDPPSLQALKASPKLLPGGVIVSIDRRQATRAGICGLLWRSDEQTKMTRPLQGGPEPRKPLHRRSRGEGEGKGEEIDSNKRGRRGHRARRHRPTDRHSTRTQVPEPGAFITVRAKLLPILPMSSQTISTLPGTPRFSLAGVDHPPSRTCPKRDLFPAGAASCLPL